MYKAVDDTAPEIIKGVFKLCEYNFVKFIP